MEKLNQRRCWEGTGSLHEKIEKIGLQLKILVTKVGVKRGVLGDINLDRRSSSTSFF